MNIRAKYKYCTSFKESCATGINHFDHIILQNNRNFFFLIEKTNQNLSVVKSLKDPVNIFSLKNYSCQGNPFAYIPEVPVEIVNYFSIYSTKRLKQNRYVTFSHAVSLENTTVSMKNVSIEKFFQVYYFLSIAVYESLNIP